MNNSGRVVLVASVDGAGQEILVRGLLDGGHRVVVCGRHTKRLAQMIRGKTAGRLLAIAADLNDPLQAQAVIERAERRFGPIDSVLDSEELEVLAS